MLFPQKRKPDGTPTDPQESDLSLITSDPGKLAEVRKRLSNIGWFIRCLAEPIARMSNREDQCTGRFWEGRYKCQPLLDEAALAACMAYVDLNPVGARISETPESSPFTSAFERIQGQQVESASQQSRGEWLSRVELAKNHASESQDLPAGQASHRGCLAMTQSEYLQLLDWSGRVLSRGKRGSIPSEPPPILARLGLSEDGWQSLVKDFGRLFRRAAGSATSLDREATRRDQAWLHGTRQSVFVEPT
jgi:hypothetical protein